MPSTSTSPEIAEQQRSDTALLDIRDLTVGFQMPNGLKNVVHDLDLSVNHQGALALVGESGSGKSVSMRSILGLLPGNAKVKGSAMLHTEGSEGFELIGAPEPKVRRIRGRKIGMVFQNAMEAFNASLTVGSQLVEALTWHRICDRKEAKERAIQALADVGIPDPAQRFKTYPFQMSGGMRQRAMIAMSTIARPDLVIADEPTTALDVTVQKQVLDLLIKLRESGMAMIMITHDLGVARYVCDDAVVLRDGRMVEQASVKQLITAPKMDYSKQLIDAALDVGTQAEERAKTEDAEPLVVGDNLTKIFNSSGGTVTAVDGVSLEIEQGKTLGVVGESGSGKSTLARLMLHLIPPSSGEVRFDGIELASLKPAALRKQRQHMQMVFQSPYGSLLPSSTVSENISEPLRINKIGTKQERRDKSVELLELVELGPSFLDVYPRQLSGGQQQRVAIARALALEPKFLVADEPTSALDASVQVQVLDLMRDLQERLGFAMMLITHNLAVAERLSHKLMVMKKGEVMEYDETSRVFNNPTSDYTKALLKAVLPVRIGTDHEWP